MSEQQSGDDKANPNAKLTTADPFEFAAGGNFAIDPVTGELTVNANMVRNRSQRQDGGAGAVGLEFDLEASTAKEVVPASGGGRGAAIQEAMNANAAAPHDPAPARDETSQEAEANTGMKSPGVLDRVQVCDQDDNDSAGAHAYATKRTSASSTTPAPAVKMKMKAGGLDHDDSPGEKTGEHEQAEQEQHAQAYSPWTWSPSPTRQIIEQIVETTQRAAAKTMVLEKAWHVPEDDRQACAAGERRASAGNDESVVDVVVVDQGADDDPGSARSKEDPADCTTTAEESFGGTYPHDVADFCNVLGDLDQEDVSSSTLSPKKNNALEAARSGELDESVHSAIAPATKAPPEEQVSAPPPAAHQQSLVTADPTSATRTTSPWLTSISNSQSYLSRPWNSTVDILSNASNSTVDILSTGTSHLSTFVSSKIIDPLANLNLPKIAVMEEYRVAEKGAVMRRTVELDSEKLFHLPQNVLVTVMRVEGRRAMVRSGDLEGWVSVVSANGRQILLPKEQEEESEEVREEDHLREGERVFGGDALNETGEERKTNALEERTSATSVDEIKREGEEDDGADGDGAGDEQEIIRGRRASSSVGTTSETIEGVLEAAGGPPPRKGPCSSPQVISILVDAEEYSSLTKAKFLLQSEVDLLRKTIRSLSARIEENVKSQEHTFALQVMLQQLTDKHEKLLAERVREPARVVLGEVLGDIEDVEKEHSEQNAELAGEPEVTLFNNAKIQQEHEADATPCSVDDINCRRVKAQAEEDGVFHHQHFSSATSRPHWNLSLSSSTSSACHIFPAAAEGAIAAATPFFSASCSWSPATGASPASSPGLPPGSMQPGEIVEAEAHRLRDFLEQKGRDVEQRDREIEKKDREIAELKSELRKHLENQLGSSFDRFMSSVTELDEGDDLHAERVRQQGLLGATGSSQSSASSSTVAASDPASSSTSAMQRRPSSTMTRSSPDYMEKAKNAYNTDFLYESKIRDLESHLDQVSFNLKQRTVAQNLIQTYFHDSVSCGFLPNAKQNPTEKLVETILRENLRLSKENARLSARQEEY